MIKDVKPVVYLAKERLVIRSAMLLIAVLTVVISPGANAVLDTRIGVLAFRGDEKALQRWKPTAQYLQERIPTAKFTIVPLGLEEIRVAVENETIDFVITNTGQYVELEAFYGISRIATLKNNVLGKESTLFGAVIFTRADRDDIQTIEDIKGKRFMGVQRSGFGGFQMAWREMLQRGVDPFKDLQSLEFSGFPQDQVAYAVRDRIVDVGTFRGESLERMARENKIKLEDFKVINAQINSEYPVLHSTRLYPTWPIAKLKRTNKKLAELVASALIGMSKDNEAAIAADIMGWTIPVNYTPVHKLMMELKIGPYANLGEVTIADVVKRYWPWISVISVILLLLIAVTVHLIRINKKLKVADRELLNHQKELIGIVHARTSDLVVMRDQALAASEAKTRFLSNMSHELRTPLNAIIGYCELLRDDVESNGVKRWVEDLNSIDVATHHLLSIINEILDVSRIESGAAKLKVEPFSISDMLGAIMSTIQPLVAENKNTLEIKNAVLHDLVESDVLRLQDALNHILDNACKYTKNGTIAVSVTQNYVNKSLWTEFRVKDTGIGMSLDQQDKIFNVFTQGDDSTTRKFEGLGLGLAISRGYCRLLGGDITLTSEVGKGSEFTVRIPTVAYYSKIARSSA